MRSAQWKRSLGGGWRCTRGRTHLDAHEDEGFEFVAVDQREELGRGHREERLFDGTKAQWAKRRKVDAVIGLTEACDTVYNRKKGWGSA